MSRKSAKECLDKIENDATFRTKFLKAKNQEERKKLLQQFNFQFTQDEYKQAFEEKHHHHLDEKELRKIAAAGNNDTSTAHGILGHAGNFLN